MNLKKGIKDADKMNSEKVVELKAAKVKWWDIRKHLRRSAQSG